MITIVLGDTRIISASLTFLLASGASMPINLAGAAVEMRLLIPGTDVLNKPCTIVSAQLGTVQAVWTATDAVDPGTYSLEWVVTFLDGTQRTCPDVLSCQQQIEFRSRTPTC